MLAVVCPVPGLVQYRHTLKYMRPRIRDGYTARFRYLDNCCTACACCDVYCDVLFAISFVTVFRQGQLQWQRQFVEQQIDARENSVNVRARCLGLRTN